MARFRANFSDTSDDDSSEEELDVQGPPELDESESEPSSRSSTPVMEDGEAFSPVLARQKQSEEHDAEDEDEEGESGSEIDRSHSPDVRVSPPSSSPPPRNQGDPTIIPWAQRLGVDAQKMHVMQTSLFRMPEETAALKALSQPSQQNLRVPLQPLNRKHSRDSDGDGFRIDAKERPSFAHNIEPPIYRPSRKYTRVQISESIVKGSEGAIFDAGLAFGRSFRVGWGPGGTLVHFGNLCSPTSTQKPPSNFSTITKTTIRTFPNDSQGSALSAKLLQHHLSNSPISPDDDGIPFALPDPKSLHFSSFVSLFPTAERSYEASLFRLGQALFDDIDIHLGTLIPADIRNRVTLVRRKAALSAWLEDAIAPTIEAELRFQTSADAAATAFTFLCGNQIEKAVNAAMEGGYTKLATLIAQAGGDWEYRSDLKGQLQIWKEQRIDAHIDESVKKVYALLAGEVDVVDGSKGGGLEKCSDVDILKSLDWKRAFGLHLWFSEPVNASISHVFTAYDQLSRNAFQRQIARPIPWHAESKTNTPSSPWKLPSPPAAADGLFSLIQLHAEPACSLSQILTPLSFGTSPVDYSLAWHLYIILSRCMRIRDFADRGEPIHRVSRKEQSSLLEDSDEEDGEKPEGHSPSADLLASSYAFQLEGLGMIQEALFVLLHIEGPAGREKAIKDLLARSGAMLDEWTVRGIVGSLKIPVSWVLDAKALYSLDSGDVYGAYELYLDAGLYNAAHDLAVSELAPEAVVCRDLQLLKSLFVKFENHPVNAWHVRGKVFLDYVKVMTRLPEIMERQTANAVPDATDSTEFDSLIKSVPKLIGILPDILTDKKDSWHIAALAEMVSGMTRQVEKAQPLALAQIQPALMTESTRLPHIQAMAYTRFLDSIS